MLGFAPLAANPLAALAAVLVTVSSPITATGGIVFAGTVTSGTTTAITSTGGITLGGSPEVAIGRAITATGGITLSGSPVWTSLNAQTTTGGITLNGSPTLRSAGRPIPVHAVPQSFIVSADLAQYEITAPFQPFTLRGVK